MLIMIHISRLMDFGIVVFGYFGLLVFWYVGIRYIGVYVGMEFVVLFVYVWYLCTFVLNYFVYLLYVGILVCWCCCTLMS